MRPPLNLNDRLVAEASRLTGISEKTRLIHRGLEFLSHLSEATVATHE